MKTLAFLLLAAGACSPYSPDLGVAPFLCGDMDPKCPDGYQCMANGSGASVCILPNGQIPDSSSNCADDSALEPNNSYHMASPTPVADQKPSITYAGLAICPMGDVDVYHIHVLDMQNLEVITAYDPGGATLGTSILNSGGVPIVNASPVTGMEGSIRAYGAHLPAGDYYASVNGPTSGTLLTNNYKLTITVSGP
jgi:hypothetical protein